MPPTNQPEDKTSVNHQPQEGPSGQASSNLGSTNLAAVARAVASLERADESAIDTGGNDRDNGEAGSVLTSGEGIERNDHPHPSRTITSLDDDEELSSSLPTNQPMRSIVGKSLSLSTPTFIHRQEQEDRARKRRKIRQELDEIKEITTAPSKVADEIESKIEELQEKIDDEVAVGKLMYELAEYTSTPANLTIIAVSGGLEGLGTNILFDAVKQYLTNKTVLACGLWALCNLANNAENRKAITVKGGIALVVQAMTRFPDHKQIQETGCGALGTLAMDSNNRVAIAGQGGIGLVIKAMAKLPNLKQIQEYGCFALGTLAMDDDNKIAITRLGGIKLVLQGITKFPGHKQIQEYGCFALGTLAINDDNSKSIARESGIKLVLHAMTRFPNNKQVQDSACFALGNLAIDENNKTAIAEEGGIQLIVEAMTNFCNHKQIQDNGCLALGNLSYGNDDDKAMALVAQQGGIELVVQAMTKFPNHEQLQRNGCWCIANLARNDKERATIAGDRGGVDAVVAAMKRFSNRNDILVLACCALEALGASSTRCKERIIGLKGVDLARSAWTQALSEDAKTRFKPCILRIKDRFVFSDSFLEYGCIG